MFTNEEGKRFFELMRKVVVEEGVIKPQSLTEDEYVELGDLYPKVVGIPRPEVYEKWGVIIEDNVVKEKSNA